MDKLDWTEIFADTNYPEIPDITLIEYIGEREEFDVNITNKELNNNGEINLFTLHGKHKERAIITYTIY